MLLFICETYFQLLNVLNLMEQKYKGETADLVLTKSSDFSAIADELRAGGVFRDVLTLDFVQEQDRDELAKNIGEYIAGREYKNLDEIIKLYTDYFIPVDSSLLQKLIYYRLAGAGHAPAVHIYEEGILTYLQDVRANLKTDGINHESFAESKRLENNIQEILVYDPELFCAGNSYPVCAMPKISPDSPVVQVLRSFFGAPELPEERYIYLAEPFAVEGLNIDELALLDRIADNVGRENMIVKLHPRTNASTFEMSGFKTFRGPKIPWELYVLNEGFADKVLLTISSGAGTTSKLLYDLDFTAVYLFNVVTLSQRYHVKHPNFRKYFSKMLELYNKDEKRLFCPGNMTEMDMVLKYIEGEIK